MLGSDPEGRMLEAYGVWVEKSLYGRKYMGIERATFLIGADGKVARVWRKVKVRSEEHTSELQSLMRISYDVFCLNTKHKKQYTTSQYHLANLTTRVYRNEPHIRSQ